jgi:hypothetical protein
MRGLRGTSAAAVGVCALVAAGGGYALASGSSGGKITVCVSHHGGALYKAKKCAKHDKKLTWNKQGIQGIQGIQGPRGNTGPQGPGATSIVHSWAGAASPTREPLGTIGPWTATGLCTTSGGSTTNELDFTGPGVDAYGLGVGTAVTAQPIVFHQPGPLTNTEVNSLGATTTLADSSADDLLVPTSGSRVQVLLTSWVTGASPPSGYPANTCFVSAAITPAAAATGATAAFRGATVTKTSGSLSGQ